MYRVLGLSETAIGVYRLMLTRREWGVDDIAAHLGLTHEQVRAHLDELVEAAMLRPSWERPDGLRAVDPHVALAALARRRKSALQESLAQVEQVAELLATEVGSTSTRFPAPVDAERLDGIDSVRGRLEYMGRQARTEALAFVVGTQSEAALDASAEVDREALSRGVAIRAVYTDNAVKDGLTRRYAQWLGDLGACVRTVPSLPMRMLVVDRSAALIPVDPADSAAGALLLREPGAVTAVVALFDAYWQAGLQLPSATDTLGRAGEPPEALGRHDREMLRLMASGAIDESVARSLGISVRTARRSIAALMSTIGAGSRFQAGVEAARRGWV